MQTNKFEVIRFLMSSQRLILAICFQIISTLKDEMSGNESILDNLMSLGTVRLTHLL